MARLFSLLLIVIGASSSWGALYLNYEEDLRATYSVNEKELSGDINAMSGSIRQVFSDDRGDRIILFGQAEAEHNFEEIGVHQLYGRYKGPMGKWNISVGRVPLPWGLNTSWTAERNPYTPLYKFSGILKNDNGVLINGTMGMVEYGISATQGFGMTEPTSLLGDGLFTGRLGISPFWGEELIVGLSTSYGTSYRGGHGVTAKPLEHRSGALDVTINWGRGTYHIEIGVEDTDHSFSSRGFIATEYQLLPKLTLIGSGNLIWETDHQRGTLFGGIATQLKSVTIRGGYEYEKEHTEKQKIVLQLYRQSSFNRY